MNKHYLAPMLPLPYGEIVPLPTEKQKQLFRERLRQKINDSPRSVKELAEIAGIAPSRLYALQNPGGGWPGTKTLIGLRKALGVNPEWLTGETDTDPSGLPGLKTYLTGEFMSRVEEAVAAEARRMADQEWEMVLSELDDETARRVRVAREAALIRGAGGGVPRPADLVQPQPQSNPSPVRRAS